MFGDGSWKNAFKSSDVSGGSVSVRRLQDNEIESQSEYVELEHGANYLEEGGRRRPTAA